MTLEKKSFEKVLNKCTSKEHLELKIQEKLDEYVWQIQYSNLEILMDLTGVYPSDQQIQKCFSAQIHWGHASEILYLSDILKGIKPTQDTIKKGYSSYFKDRTSFGDLNDLIKAIGIPPEEIIQESYSNLILKDSTYSLDNLKKLIEIIKIAPSDEVVQAGYLHYLQNHKIDDIPKLKDITKIELKLPAETLEDIYNQYLKDREPMSVRGLFRLTVIKPPEESMQETYSYFTRKGDEFSIIYLKQAGVEPNVSQEDIQEGYTSSIKREVYKFEAMINIFKIKPEIPKEVVMEVYCKIFHEGKEWDLSKIKRLQNLTGVNPSKESVQQAYYHNISNPDFIYKLSKITGIKPKLSEKSVQETYLKFVEKGELENISGLQEVTGIVPSLDVYRALACQLGIQVKNLKIM